MRLTELAVGSLRAVIDALPSLGYRRFDDDFLETGRLQCLRLCFWIELLAQVSFVGGEVREPSKVVVKMGCLGQRRAHAGELGRAAVAPGDLEFAFPRQRASWGRPGFWRRL